MRKIVTIGAFVLTACNQSGGVSTGNATEETAAPAVDVAAMLEANDMEVCGVQEVQDLALQVVDADYPAFIANGGDRIRFEVVNANDIDPVLHQISCSAKIRTIHFYRSHDGSGGGEEREVDAAFEYRVRPAVGGNYVVETMVNKYHYFVDQHINRARYAEEWRDQVAAQAARQSEEALEADVDANMVSEDPPVTDETVNAM